MHTSILRPNDTPAEPVDACVVIDVLRATTTAAVLCQRLGELYVLRTPAELARLPSRSNGYALFSELADLEADMPRFDNSPVQARDADLAGRMPVLVTTNGTHAVAIAARHAAEVVLAAFVNLTAIVEYIRGRGFARVAVMPAGHVRKAQRHAEDEGCAEAIVARLSGAAVDIPNVIETCRGDARIIERRAREANLEPDIALCFGLDSVPVVPRVVSANDDWFAVSRP